MKVAKKARVARYLKGKAPKPVEDEKVALFLRANKTSEASLSALRDLFSLKKPAAKMFSRRNQVRPFEDETSVEFLCDKNDAATCVVSVDYLIKPLEVFKEINRVLKPGGKFILSQSNRCFQTKAVMMWLQQSDLQHCQVIGSYFHYAGGFAPARAFDVSPKGPRTNDPLFIVESTKL